MAESKRKASGNGLEEDAKGSQMQEVDKKGRKWLSSEKEMVGEQMRNDFCGVLYESSYKRNRKFLGAAFLCEKSYKMIRILLGNGLFV